MFSLQGLGGSDGLSGFRLKDLNGFRSGDSGGLSGFRLKDLSAFRSGDSDKSNEVLRG
ncbi:MAG: hypothetical protein JWN30_385 [Bacilli bacterium]|nr:hypothetical protein [Bacilli bacterium]